MPFPPMEVMNCMFSLHIDHLKKSFDKKEVLKDVSFEFKEGNIYGLLGRNGAGKTTLFNCLNEDIKTDGGSFMIFDESGQRAVEARDIGCVLSVPVVPEFLTAREFLKFFLEINGKEKEDIDTYFDFMSIEAEDQDRLLKDYSHGMKNKMQMLVNFIANLRVLLLDEPLTSFDVVVAEEMKQMLRQIKKNHIIIFSTHIMELALDLCDEIVILNHGVLEEIPKEHLNQEAFKDRIIDALRGGEDD